MRATTKLQGTTNTADYIKCQVTRYIYFLSIRTEIKVKLCCSVLLELNIISTYI